MKPERWRQITETFHAGARARAVTCAAAFLAEACDGDLDLRRGSPTPCSPPTTPPESFGERPALRGHRRDGGGAGPRARSRPGAPRAARGRGFHTAPSPPFVWASVRAAPSCSPSFGYRGLPLARGGQRCIPVNNLTNLLGLLRGGAWLGCFIGSRPAEPCAARLACLSAWPPSTSTGRRHRPKAASTRRRPAVGYQLLLSLSPDGGFPRGMWRTALVSLNVMGAAAIAGELWLRGASRGGLTLIGLCRRLAGCSRIPYK